MTTQEKCISKISKIFNITEKEMIQLNIESEDFIAYFIIFKDRGHIVVYDNRIGNILLFNEPLHKKVHYTENKDKMYTVSIDYSDIIVMTEYNRLYILNDTMKRINSGIYNDLLNRVEAGEIDYWYSRPHMKLDDVLYIGEVIFV